MVGGAKKHSKLGASVAERWLNCAASIELIDKAPPAVETEYAAEGTRAHDWLEYVIRRELLLEKVKAPGFKPNLEMENHVQDAVNWIESQWNYRGGDILQAEQQVDLSHIDESMFGTLDISIIRPFGTLTIADFKYGAGVVVEPQENEQLMYYALAIAKEHDFNFLDCEIVVIQPRAPHDEGPIRSWYCTMEDLKGFEELLRKGVKRVKRGGNEPIAGDWCRFCPAAVICPALSDRATEAARAAFDDDPGFGPPDVILDEENGVPYLPDPKDLSPEKVAVILQNARQLEAWIIAVKGYAEGLMERGGRIEGYKLVYKQARRHWNNQKDAANWAQKNLGGKAFKLLSPSQLEKIANKEQKKEIKAMVTAISSGLTIAHELDKREAVDHIKDVFDDGYLLTNKGDTNEEDKEESRKEKRKESKRKGKGKAKAQSEEVESIFDEDLGF